MEDFEPDHPPFRFDTSAQNLRQETQTRFDKLTLDNLQRDHHQLRVMAVRAKSLHILCVAILIVAFSSTVFASLGDQLPDFQECVQECTAQNCQSGQGKLPLNLRLMLWTCPAECDYTCQHIITEQRLAREPPMMEPIVQFHGKWPFYRFMGMQEPFSVLFSLLNFLAHRRGLDKIRHAVPVKYPLRPYYVAFGYFGLSSWIFSMLFHTRDFNLTEKLDYFAAGASVFYGLYYTPVRVFRLDQRTPTKQSILRSWTGVCIFLYVCHVLYLTCWRWDYTYNMAANVAAGIVQNLLWTWFSIRRYRKSHQSWTAWPGLIVAWIVLAMSLELFDFPPFGFMLDAHSLWHLGTVGPTIWWYNFLIKDTQEDLAMERLKA